MSRSVVYFALAVGILLSANAACVNTNVRVPDVRINTSDYGTGSDERRTPYAKDLDKVLGQQKNVEKKLQKRDWEDVNSDVSDWMNQTRKLMGKADTSKNPAKMKEYCRALLTEMDSMQRAARAEDSGGVRAAIDRAQPWLNRLSSEFPLSEPKPAAEQSTPQAP